MEFPQNLAGKWVAIKNEKFVDSGKNLKRLRGRMKKRADQEQIGYSFVPKGAIAGLSHGI
jgi:hypothetical protein